MYVKPLKIIGKGYYITHTHTRKYSTRKKRFNIWKRKTCLFKLVKLKIKFPIEINDRQFNYSKNQIQENCIFLQLAKFNL